MAAKILEKMTCCLALLMLSPSQAEELSQLPMFDVAGVKLGMSEQALLALYPDVKKGVASPNGQQYWISDEALLLLEFRDGGLAVATSSRGDLAKRHQMETTAAVYDELVRRFGQPQRMAAGKLTRKGVARVSALLFNLDTFHPDASLVFESSEIELALTIVDTKHCNIDRIVFSPEALLIEVSKGEERPPALLEDGVVVDFLAETRTGSQQSVLQTSDRPNSKPNETQSSGSSEDETVTPEKERKTIKWLWILGGIILLSVSALAANRRL